MASFTPFTILLLTWLLMALPLCFSESRLFRFQDDIRPLIPLDEFGFTSPGGLELVLSHFSFSFSPPIHPHPDLSQVGFFLWPRQSLTHLIRQFDNRQIECPLRTDIVKKSALTFHDFVGRSSNSFTMFRSIDVDEHYTLLFANCVEGMKISMEVESSMFDLISPGVFSPGNYLSAGEKPLPIVYLLFCSAYFALTLLWTLRFLIGYKK
ncbi:hypothetical protein TIFTF001_003190 [Ficus carica]|uniref:CAND6/7 N-terminal domain-containing protein n=1 Tax=Ficus carica TaxID=3494 RepID=A0AA87Z6Y4_FICCA|nr:hypothetical protein TIFTF001_003190 [Ficus carica]